MTKQIVFYATDNGIDGREPTKILYASFSETELDVMIDADRDKRWRGKCESIINIEVAKNQALAKLNGIDKLILGL